MRIKIQYISHRLWPCNQLWILNMYWRSHFCIASMQYLLISKSKNLVASHRSRWNSLNRTMNLLMTTIKPESTTTDHNNNFLLQKLQELHWITWRTGPSVRESPGRSLTKEWSQFKSSNVFLPELPAASSSIPLPWTQQINNIKWEPNPKHQKIILCRPYKCTWSWSKVQSLIELVALFT
jgi:hypothetical protein